MKSASNKKLNSPPLNRSTTGMNSKNNRNIKEPESIQKSYDKISDIDYFLTPS
jgi:hypothetical protein